MTRFEIGTAPRQPDRNPGDQAGPEGFADSGIVVRCHNRAALAEEASEAYKDVANVVDVLERAGISRNVAKMRPLGVIKG